MSNRPKGATVADTRKFRDKMIEQGANSDAFRQLGKTGLWVSSVGFGAYRAKYGDQDHEKALYDAVMAGCNLIDTSTNYCDGGSEQLVGHTVENVASQVPREQIVVVSKIGYIQGTNLRKVMQRSQSGQHYPELVRYMEGCWHCIHPEFLEAQLNEILLRTNLSKLDVLLLHNPEYFFSDCDRRKDPRSLEERREAFYVRIQRAFKCMEGLVKKGLISHYGVSSNTLVAPTTDSCATSLHRLLSAAKEAGGDDNHFQVIQIPLNLYESGALSEIDQESQSKETTLELATQAQLGVLTNRPLNAYVGNKLVRLAEIQFDAPGAARAKLLRHVERLEKEFSVGIGNAIDDGSGNLRNMFQFSQPLSRLSEHISDVMQWDEYVSRVFGPQLSQRINELEQGLQGPILSAWHFWLDRYVEGLSKLSDAYRAQCAKHTMKNAQKINKRITRFVPRAAHKKPLSQKSVALMKSIRGVTSVLVGMRTPNYVQDTMETLYWPEFQTDQRVFAEVALI